MKYLTTTFDVVDGFSSRFPFILALVVERGFVQNSGLVVVAFSWAALWGVQVEMFVEQIERMKRQYTDKYVVVDAARPELARFRDVVGRVKTVNMNGQALVEFDDYHLNIGWYDIAPEFLKVVDKPPPKPPKPEAKKPTAKAEAKPAAAAKTPAAKAPAAAKPGKASVADILAAARAGKAPAPVAPKAEAAPAAEEQPSAPPKPQAAAKVDRSKMNVAEMLSAARAGGAAGLVPAKAKSEAAPAASQVEETPEEPAAEAPTAAASAPSGKTVTRVDKSGMSIDEILAYCRQHDAK